MKYILIHCLMKLKAVLLYEAETKEYNNKRKERRKERKKERKKITKVMLNNQNSSNIFFYNP